MTDEITLDAPETRIERFLAAAAGVEGITLDEPETRIEKYLYNIAQNAGGALPPITDADDGKVLTANSGVWVASGNIELTGTRSGDNVTITTSPLPTHADFVNAYNMGRNVVLSLNNGTEKIILAPFIHDVDSNYAINSVTFCGIGVDFDIRQTKVYLCANWDDGTQTGTITTKIVSLDPFYVLLTPTAADYSGTMDKTVAEIDAAYKAGRKVVFRVMTGATTYREVDCATRVDIGVTYPSYSGYLIDNVNNVLIVAYTGASNDGTEATYGTYIFPLTPAT